jgi:hypothetical protein
VVATVADTGVGIGPEFLPRLFDRFTQADTSSTRRYGGLGLGLAIARNLVELHGGRVSAASDGVGRRRDVLGPSCPPRSSPRRSAQGTSPPRSVESPQLDGGRDPAGRRRSRFARRDDAEPRGVGRDRAPRDVGARGVVLVHGSSAGRRGVGPEHAHGGRIRARSADSGGRPIGPRDRTHGIHAAGGQGRAFSLRGSRRTSPSRSTRTSS